MQQSHFALYEYRDKIARIKEENDNLIFKENENKKVIKDLLALNNSVEQHVHFSEDASPERLLSYAKTHEGKNIHQRNKENYPGKINGQEEAPRKDPKFRTPNIIRTVYLENSDISELRRELEQLQKDTLEEKYLYDHRIIQARNDKAELDEYARQELLSDNDRIHKLIQEFEHIDQLSLDTFNDYGQLIQESDAQIRRKEEENEKLRIENAQLGAKIKKVQKECEDELRRAEQEYEKQTQEYSRFKKQSDIQTEYINIIKDQYEKIQEIYREKSKALLEKIEKAKKRMNKTEARRSLELAGYYEDLRLLNKKSSVYIENKMPLKMLQKLKKEQGVNAESARNVYDEDQDEEPDQHYGDNNEEPSPGVNL